MYVVYEIWLIILLILVLILQQFQVVATENVNPAVLESDIHCAAATEKIDGTCCYVTTYKGIWVITWGQVVNVGSLLIMYKIHIFKGLWVDKSSWN